MVYIFVSAILFGFVYPGSKFILGQGLDPLSFCLLYAMARLAVQGLIALKKRSHRVADASILISLVTIGVVGASLQFCEFTGVSSGLSIPIVTFLAYSHPVWSFLLSRVINGERFNLMSLFQVVSGLFGIVLIAGSSFAHLNLSTELSAKLALKLLIAPLIAAILIALWVSLVNKAKHQGTSTWTISFYYDLFALCALIGLRTFHGVDSMALGELFAWVAVPVHSLEIVGYAVLVGVIPNLLFYHGNASVGARAAGLILLIEPLVATGVSHFVWHDELSRYFCVGAVFVLLAGLPKGIVVRCFRLPAFLRALSISFAAESSPTSSKTAV
jgi:drug/metabolite transporter (DMT)-like permease